MLPKIGVVGTPDQVTILVPILQVLEYQVTALWCKDPDERSKLAKKFGIPFVASDFKDLLLHSDVDLVYVSTEPGRQAEVAVKALTSGKHCICQKPPSISRSEAQKMVRLSQYYNKLHSLLESHLRFLPAVTKLKELLSQNYCGQLLVMEAHVVMGSLIFDEPYSWKCETSMGGGVLNRVGAHIIDLISFVSDQHACKAHASLNTFRPTTNSIHGYRTITSDDFCCFQLKCTSGLAATVTLNSHAPGQFNFQFSVSGTHGRLVVQGLDLLGSRDGGKEEVLLRQEGPDLDKYGIKDSMQYPKDFLNHLVLGYQEMFEAMKRNFWGSQCSMKSNMPSKRVQQQNISISLPSATFEDGVYIRTVLDALHCSSVEEKWVDIPEMDSPEPSNPFWTSSSRQLEAEKSSPRIQRSIYV